MPERGRSNVARSWMFCARQLFVMMLHAPWTDSFPGAAGYRAASTGTGKSASSVVHLTCPGKPALSLKTAAGRDVADLVAEHERHVWLPVDPDYRLADGFF